MKVIINIEKGNDAMKSNRNVFAAIKRLKLNQMQGNIRDINGNTVGNFKVYEHVLNIHAFEWFDKSAGNRYFQAVATLDGDSYCIPFTSGYGDHYIHVCVDRLIAAKLLPAKKSPMQSSWQYFEEKHILNSSSIYRNKLKREMLAHGDDLPTISYNGEIKA